MPKVPPLAVGVKSGVSFLFAPLAGEDQEYVSPPHAIPMPFVGSLERVWADSLDRSARSHPLAILTTLVAFSLVRGRCVNVLTNEKKQDNARSHSDIVEISENGHAVIGVRIVQCHHAIMDNCDFATFGPNFNLVPIPTCCQAVWIDRHFSL